MNIFRVHRYRVLIVSGATIFTSSFLYKKSRDRFIVQADQAADDSLKPRWTKGLPSRDEQLRALKETKEYDILVIGGGATGAGVALDSVTRGFKTALIELDDFASGTSSRSTKLVHGGLRNLQKAIYTLDFDQYKMVNESLRERASLMKIAPHLVTPLQTMLPIYKLWQVPYFWFGMKFFDIFSGKYGIKSSYYLSKKETLKLFPFLNEQKLRASLVFYDGQQDDARMNLAVILTAARYGATVANHVRVTALLKNADGKLYGAKVRDLLTDKEWEVKAKCIVNATGPFTDSIRAMDDQETEKICRPVAGVHITLPGYYSPGQIGILDPDVNGKVIFLLPWQNFTIAGAAEKKAEVTFSPTPTEADIQVILDRLKKYLNSNINVRRGDVMSAWCGIMPLVIEPSKKDKPTIAKNHVIDVSASGLVTIAGGRWMTYRKMAEDTLNEIEKNNPFLAPQRKCQTENLLLEGAHDWSPTMYIRLVQNYGIDPEIARHLTTSYGDRAFAVAKLAEITGKRWPVVGSRLHSEFPYIKAEIRFAVREYACSAVDVLARRMRIAFLNVEAAQEILPTVIDVMAEELKWSKAEKKKQFDDAMNFLNTQMGLGVNKESIAQKTLSLNEEDSKKYTKQFQTMDKDKKGYISINDLRRSVKASGQRLTDDDLHAILSEVDLNKNGKVELSEYLELISSLKSGLQAQSRFAAAVQYESNQ